MMCTWLCSKYYYDVISTIIIILQQLSLIPLIEVGYMDPSILLGSISYNIIINI